MPVFTANIPAILKVGDKIEIGGKIKENARKMSINLCAQEGEEPRDVVLHFDVRFHRDNIISLSRKNGIWIGSGNYDTNYNMFVPGTVFRIVFEIKDTDVITIYCQGKFHSNFLPKIPLSMAHFLVAWADVERITHCYFHFGNKGEGEECPAPAVFPAAPCAVSPVLGADMKRCPRVHKKGVPDMDSLPESSDDDQSISKPRPKAEGRADRFFYDTLMCQTADGTYERLPEKRRENLARFRSDYSKKGYRDSETDSEMSDEDDPSKNKELSAAECESVSQDAVKKRSRRARLSSPFVQVANFMGKTKRN